MNLFGNDALTVTRFPKTGANKAATTVWTGWGDVAVKRGSLVTSSDGTVVSIEAVAIIDTDPVNGLPPIQVDDRVAWNGRTFVVVAVRPWSAPPGAHMELHLAAGPTERYMIPSGTGVM